LDPISWPIAVISTSRDSEPDLLSSFVLLVAEADALTQALLYDTWSSAAISDEELSLSVVFVISMFRKAPTVLPETK
jgi:hypothetical protein